VPSRFLDYSFHYSLIPVTPYLSNKFLFSSVMFLLTYGFIYDNSFINMADEEKIKYHLFKEEEEGSSNILGYPKHVASFETYYYLGELRTLKAAALLRFQALIPDCPPDSPSFKSKFDSFYTKIKRWARAEDWDGWCIRKAVEERQKRDKDVRQKMMSLDKTVRTYQSLVRQALVVWSDKIRTSVELRNAIASGDEAKIIALSQRERMEIKSFSEARLMMELDFYLSKLLEDMPESSTDEREKLTEDEQERADRVMEYIRKRALDEAKGIKDSDE